MISIYSGATCPKVNSWLPTFASLVSFSLYKCVTWPENQLYPVDFYKPVVRLPHAALLNREIF